MSDSITFREMKLEGGCLIIRPERQDLGKAMAVVRKHKDRLYDLEIKEHREKRSLDANAYAWVWTAAEPSSPTMVHLSLILRRWRD